MARTKEYEPDEVAMLFPLMEGAPYELMKADVAERGFVEKGTIHKGKLLDGRNRQRIALELGIEFPVVQYDGDPSPLSLFRFVVSKNLHRRHLNESQRAILAARSKPLLERIRAENKERQREGAKKGAVALEDGEALPQAERDTSTNTREQLGEMWNVSGHLVSDAVTIDEDDPDAGDVILAGAKTVTEVKRERKAAEDAALASAERSDQSSRIKIVAPPEVLKTVDRYRLIIVGTEWVRETGGEWLETMGTDKPLEECADENCLLMMLTGGDANLGHKCGTLIDNWFFKRARRYFPLIGTEKFNGEPWEPIIVGVRGNVPWEDIIPRAPLKCGKNGIEATLLDASLPWLKEHHAEKLVLNFASKIVAKGAVNWPLKGDPVAA